ncbi:phage repressor protein [Enterococcus sp. BWR-S5]|uniref:phage repressor protein n=1 Tax=Enterococcus sp. BWR-S5 TaxID=2787714 RepID=UPI001924E6D7|nr:phage repressor protein [Enterococcus sp. BWR-S5]MBL1224473.1 phage repressor protein [Enterococcus sp. BWR-S5]
MSKASFIASLLQQGRFVEKYKEAGNSMLPLLKSNQPVSLEPITDDSELTVKDIVFCKVKGNYYTHLISAIRTRNNQVEYQISNNHGFVNGWVKRKNIFGKVVKIW